MYLDLERVDWWLMVLIPLPIIYIINNYNKNIDIKEDKILVYDIFFLTKKIIPISDFIEFRDYVRGIALHKTCLLQYWDGYKQKEIYFSPMIFGFDCEKINEELKERKRKLASSVL